MREKGTLISKAYRAYEPDQLFLMPPTSYNVQGKTQVLNELKRDFLYQIVSEALERTPLRGEHKSVSVV
jgi:hypothetical protein